MNCVHCGKPLDPTKRKHAKYCSSKCRTYASRKRQRAEKNQQLHTLHNDINSRIEAIMNSGAPRSAARLRALVEQHDLECSPDVMLKIISLCMEAWTEGLTAARAG